MLFVVFVCSLGISVGVFIGSWRKYGVFIGLKSGSM